MKLQRRAAKELYNKAKQSMQTVATRDKKIGIKIVKNET